MLQEPNDQAAAAAMPGTRRKRTLPAVLYIVLAALTTLASGAGIVWLERCSHRESLLDVTLSRVQVCGYRLANVEEAAHDRRQFSAQLADEDNRIDAQARMEIGVIRSLNKGEMASGIGLTFSALNANLNAEYDLINKSHPVEAEAFAAGNVDPLFGKLNREIGAVSETAHKRSDQANLLALLGSVVLFALAAVSASILFRRFERSQRTLTQLSTEKATLERSERRFETLVRNASDLIVIIGRGELISFVVSAAERVWEYQPQALYNAPVLSLVLNEDITAGRELLDQVRQSESAIVHGELRIRHGDGSYRPSEVILTNLSAERGIEGIVFNCRDVSERKAAEAKIAHQAFHDPLTDLPNRALFMERLNHALARGQRSQCHTAAIFLDLDNFKVINDSLGHEAGDTLLKTVADRLKALVRPGDTVARLGGDEFTILLEDIESDAEAMAVAERIVEVLQMPASIVQREVFISASMGIAMSRGEYASAEDLLRDADTAMYQAKAGAKGHSVIFDLHMNARAVERLELEIGLHDALDSGQLRVYYQPIISLGSGAINEVEALVRWEHPTRGLILPSVFIPIAEESGLIVRLGAWVLETACGQIMKWHSDAPDKEALSLSVNLSVRQLQEPDLVASVMRILDRVGMDSRQLKLEITESVMVRDPAHVTKKLEALKELGIRISVDDFGTGYSSMSYLSGLPLDTLKIDRSFVSKMGRSEGDEAIVRAIVTLAKALNLRITAEGIETVEQLDRLRSLDCDQGQGYLYSQPLCAGDMTNLLTNAGSSDPLHEHGEELPLAA